MFYRAFFPSALVPRSDFVKFNQYLRLLRILLILEPFIRDGDILSLGTKLRHVPRTVLRLYRTDQQRLCDVQRRQHRA